jgi:hypothetical protein
MLPYRKMEQYACAVLNILFSLVTEREDALQAKRMEQRRVIIYNSEIVRFNLDGFVIH